VRQVSAGTIRLVSDQDRMTAGDLVIAVYLDTNVLLDLLATVEDGFSLVERVTTGQTGSSASERSGTADFGAPSVFNFFKFGFSGKLGKSTSKGTSETTEAELTHTYGSLLHRLRRYLVEESLIATIASDGDLAVDVGSFIEFRGVVRANPFTASFHLLQRMLRYADLTTPMQATTQPPPSAGKSGRSRNQPRRTLGNKEAAERKAMGEFFEQLTADVEREGTSTILLESQVSEYRAVVTLFDDFLRDRSMAELLNREFRVLGKAARHLRKDSPEGVDLLASSGIAGFPPEILAELSGAIDEMSGAGMARVATPSTTIDPPVIEIVPIAIYL
jgi:hypothetical protein